MAGWDWVWRVAGWSMHEDNASVHHPPGLPVTYGLRVFDPLEPKFTPFKSVLCMELTL